ncbi:hypothetical protein QNH98_14655 [Myroides sp. mNGS23_01]|nr:hypothetical protein [Myroides sp. mNGS23_01]WHT38274.1 hypothetical protein QNH98_14655 [Myroides sp. mNGS23_01]
MITFTTNNGQPTTVAFIQSLVWSKKDVTIMFLCQEKEEGKGWPNREEAFVVVEVQFLNCTQLKLNVEGDILQPAFGFDILDVSAKGWENINFQIEEYENDCIGFYCEAIEVLPVFSKTTLKLYE